MEIQSEERRRKKRFNIRRSPVSRLMCSFARLTCGMPSARFTAPIVECGEHACSNIAGPASSRAIRLRALLLPTTGFAQRCHTPERRKGSLFWLTRRSSRNAQCWAEILTRHIDGDKEIAPRKRHDEDGNLQRALDNLALERLICRTTMSLRKPYVRGPKNSQMFLRGRPAPARPGSISLVTSAAAAQTRAAAMRAHLADSVTHDGVRLDCVRKAMLPPSRALRPPPRGSRGPLLGNSHSFSSRGLRCPRAQAIS